MYLHFCFFLQIQIINKLYKMDFNLLYKYTKSVWVIEKKNVSLFFINATKRQREKKKR